MNNQVWVNSIDADKTPQDASSDLVLLCLSHIQKFSDYQQL